jgi:replicative DNA helicase
MTTEAQREQEAALIGACMADQRQFDEIRERVSTESFSWHPYRWTWDAMLRLRERGLGVDVITVGDELDREQKLDQFQTHHTKQSSRIGLSVLRSDASPRNAQSYAANVMDYAAKEMIIPVLERAAYWSKNGRLASDIKKDLATEIDAIRTFDGKAAQHTVSISDATKLAEDRTGRASRGEIVYVETGLTDLDNLLGGGAETPDFIIVAGRPGSGKSSFMTTIASNASKKGKRVALFTLEMSEQQIAMRLISQESGISYKKQKTGKLNDTEWVEYDHAVEVVNGLPIVINDLPAITMSQMRQALRAMGKVDLILFDYIQLARADEKQGTREQEVSFVSRWLKQIAKEFDAPVIAGAQLSREIEKRASKKPMLSDLRESGSLEQDSDIVIFLHKPDELINAYELIVAKHRNGEVGSIDSVFVPHKTRFENAAREKVFDAR